MPALLASLALATTPVPVGQLAPMHQLSVEIRSQVDGRLVAAPSASINDGKVARITVQCDADAHDCTPFAIDMMVAQGGMLTTVSLTYREWRGDAWTTVETPPIVFLGTERESRFEAGGMQWNVRLDTIPIVAPQTI